MKKNMKIIISPAKKMKTDTDTFLWEYMPVFLKHAQELLTYLKSLSYDEAKSLWKCNDKIARMNYKRMYELETDRNLTPAILAYEGIQYQYMAPSVFENGQISYIESHLRILSGFYGILRPLDGIIPYRLEMGAKAAPRGFQNLYEFWGKNIYNNLSEGTDCILNLASKEYSKTVEKYLDGTMRYVTVVFGSEQNGRVIQKATVAKMARGEMVRYMAECQAEKPEDIIGFNRLGFTWSPEYSDEKTITFLSCQENNGEK